MQEDKKTLLIQRHGTSEFVPIAVAPSDCAGDVLAAIGAPGALGLATGGRYGLVFLAPATLWNWVADGTTLYTVRSS